MKRVVDFYVHQDLSVPAGFFSKLIDDVNFVLSKNTDLILTLGNEWTGRSSEPFDEQGMRLQPGIVRNYRYIAWFYPTSPQNRGSVSSHYDGSTVLKIGRKRIRPEKDDPTDYENLVNAMLHEVAHDHGAGIGEYYRTAVIPDTTRVAPLLDVSTLNPTCRYWARHSEFLLDPLLRPASPHKSARFSPLSASIITKGKFRMSDYLPPIADHNKVLVKVVRSDYCPIPDAELRMFGGLKSKPSMVSSCRTNENGLGVLSWGCEPLQMTVDPSRFIKAYASDMIPGVCCITLWDHQAAAMAGYRNLSVTIMLFRANEHPRLEFAQQLAEERGVWGWSVGDGMPFARPIQKGSK